MTQPFLQRYCLEENSGINCYGKVVGVTLTTMFLSSLVKLHVLHEIVAQYSSSQRNAPLLYVYVVCRYIFRHTIFEGHWLYS